MIANNDEEGRVFFLNKETFTLENEMKLLKKGDYESIESFDEFIVICKNNGHLSLYNRNTEKTEEIKMPFKNSNNVEGMGHDIRSNSLLIACKGKALDTDSSDKCIYNFNLETRVLDEVAFFCLSPDDLISKYDELYNNETTSTSRKVYKRLKKFAPSGIAVHPLTGDFFVVSARGGILIKIDRSKNLYDITLLHEKTIPQPEGIAFDDNNHLYIATEGKGGSGKIVRFEYLN